MADLVVGKFYHIRDSLVIYKYIGKLTSGFHAFEEGWFVKDKFVADIAVSQPAVSYLSDTGVKGLEETRPMRNGTFWVNIWNVMPKVLDRGGQPTWLFKSREEADTNAQTLEGCSHMKRVACIEIDWTEGDGL